MKNDRKVAELIEGILAKKDGEINTFEKNWELAKQLSAKGKITVDPILDKLFELKDKGKIEGEFSKNPIFCLIRVAVEHAGPKHAEKLAQMLLWDEICLDKDGSNRLFILSALEKFGSIKIVPLLERHAERVKLIKYRPVPDGYSIKQLHEKDQRRVGRTIKACKKRI